MAYKKKAMLKIINERGNCCEDCKKPYDENEVFQWHHRDTKTKLFNVGDKWRSAEWGKVICEIAKCDFLCGECHGKRHDKSWVGARTKESRVRKIGKLSRISVVTLIMIMSLAIYPAEIFANSHSKRIARLAINNAFCGGHPRFNCVLGRQGMAVAGCETGGTFDPYAGYGKHEYWGIFQFGEWARKHYGFKFNAWDQARAAKKYYNDYGWSGWSCKPY